jgi:hypothetical protein
MTRTEARERLAGEVDVDLSVNTSLPSQEAKSLSDLHSVVRDALSEAMGGEVTGPLLHAHACDKQGRNWNVSGYTPSRHRELIDGLRDRYVAK